VFYLAKLRFVIFGLGPPKTAEKPSLVQLLGVSDTRNFWPFDRFARQPMNIMASSSAAMLGWVPAALIPTANRVPHRFRL
jgi:hypothetical protein